MYGFNDAMKELNKIAPLGSSKPTAAEWLMKIDPKIWARWHFTTHCRSDILVNNLCESSWNAYILEAKEKGIINMLEWIRRRLMTRMQIKRTGVENYEGSIGPRIQKKLELNKKHARNCNALCAGLLEFEVECDDRSFIVHLGNMTCGCRLWDLSGIPCKHACAAI